MFKVISFSLYYTSSPVSFLGSWTFSLFRCSLYIRDFNALGKIANIFLTLALVFLFSLVFFSYS